MTCTSASVAAAEGPPGDASCLDLIDNDGDGLVDIQDPDCRFAANPSIDISEPVFLANIIRAEGSFTITNASYDPGTWVEVESAELRLSASPGGGGATSLASATTFSPNLEPGTLLAPDSTTELDFSSTYSAPPGTVKIVVEVRVTLVGRIHIFTATTGGMEVDSDFDGWPDGAELFIGTDPLVVCSWPPDPAPEPNGNGVVQIDDVTFAASAFGSTTTPRAEIATQNGVVQIDDLTAAAGRFGQSPGPSCRDSDIDGWTDAAEGFIGIDPLNPCTPGGWAPDPLPLPGGNGIVQIDDVTFAASAFGSTTTRRAEIATQNGVVQIDDVTAFASRFGDMC